MTQKKISNYIRLFVLLLPIIIISFAVFRTGDYAIVSNIYADYFDVIPQFFNDFYNNYVSSLGFDSYFFYFAYNYLVYVFCVEFTMLIFDFILFIPRWIRGLIFSYEKKNKN